MVRPDLGLQCRREKGDPDGDSCSGDGDATVRCPSCGREGAVRVRNALATRMTPEQIADAHRRAREWDAAHPRER